MAYYWVRETEFGKGFDAVLGETFRALVARFPFERVAFPGRDIPWANW